MGYDEWYTTGSDSVSRARRIVVEGHAVALDAAAHGNARSARRGRRLGALRWLRARAGRIALALCLCAALGWALMPAQNANADRVTETVAYTVQPGDTLWSIAGRFDDVTVDQLKTLNRLDDGRLTAGQRLLIPA
ncbi:MAG: LysM peptidoglycan-binding domain-containing protein [Bifidobacterium sp.]|nr:LysM peptidoglycan-binding domain-containing protein [Bifidobacterium sp.]